MKILNMFAFSFFSAAFASNAFGAIGWSADIKIVSVLGSIDGAYIIDFGSSLPAVCAYPSIVGDNSTVATITLSSTERNYPNMVDGNKNMISTALAAFSAGKTVSIYYDYGIQPCRIHRIRVK